VKKEYCQLKWNEGVKDYIVLEVKPNPGEGSQGRMKTRTRDNLTRLWENNL